MLIKYLLVFLYGLFATYVATEYFITRLKKYKYVTYDMYKSKRSIIPTMGGIAIFVGVIISLALSQVLIRNGIVGKLFIFYFIIIVYAMYGVIDDLFRFKKRYDKIIVLFVLSLPIASLITHTTIDFNFFTLDFNGLYPLFLAPLYIMVVANLINVHSGFNGLSTGLSVILLLTIGVKAYLLNGFDNLLFLLPVLGAALSFLYFNFYPARILEGNIGSFLLGSAIGAFIILNRMEFFGIVILTPHIVNFIMDTYTLRIKNIPLKKFGKTRKDNTIEPPSSMRFVSLKFLITHYFRLTEKQATLVLYLVTIAFCIGGLVFV
jgi:UDP-N-acetylglucosamine--dolichyl-phosphate N-acetylglucosaminephosphotransferase